MKVATCFPAGRWGATPAGRTDRAGDFDSGYGFGSPFGVETRPLSTPAVLRSMDPRRRLARSPAHRLPR